MEVIDFIWRAIALCAILIAPFFLTTLAFTRQNPFKVWKDIVKNKK